MNPVSIQGGMLKTVSDPNRKNRLRQFGRFLLGPRETRLLRCGMYAVVLSASGLMLLPCDSGSLLITPRIVCMQQGSVSDKMISYKEAKKIFENGKPPSCVISIPRLDCANGQCTVDGLATRQHKEVVETKDELSSIENGLLDLSKRNIKLDVLVISLIAIIGEVMCRLLPLFQSRKKEEVAVTPH